MGVKMAKSKEEINLAAITIKKNSEFPVYRQLYNEFRGAILKGRFRAGQRLPATRELSKYFNISRTTVLLAFENLMLEGYLKGKQGSGTFISDEIPEHLIFATANTNLAKNYKIKKYLDSERNDFYMFKPFKPGVPDLNEFPFQTWSKLFTQSVNELSKENFGYSSSAGYKPLRKAIADYIRIARSVKCESEQVIITSGSQQGIDLATRVLLNKGDSVGFEEPGYHGGRDTFIAAEINILPMPMDEEGINFKKTKRKPELIYVTPSHHYPLGITMSLNRRLELLDYCSSNGVWVLEDDYDSEYRYNGHPLSSLQGIDNNNSVIYMGTFSKVMFPGLRLGYLVVPENLIESFTAAKMLADRNSPIFEQAALEKFITSGYYGRHIRRMRVLYEKRKEVFYKYVEKYLSNHLKLHPTEAGLHTVGWLLNFKDDNTFAKLMFENGVITPPLSGYSITKKVKPGLVLGYAAYSEQQIKTAVKKIASLL